MKFKNSLLSRSFAAMALLSLGINMTACDLLSKQKRQEEKARTEDEIKQLIEAEKADEAMVAYKQEERLFRGIDGTYTGKFIGENGTEGTVSLVIYLKTGNQIISGLPKKEGDIRSGITAMSFEAHLVVSTKDYPQAVDCYSSGIPLNQNIDSRRPEALKFSCPAKEKHAFSSDVLVYLDDAENGQEPFQLDLKQAGDILQRRTADQIARLRAGQKQTVTRMNVAMKITHVMDRLVGLYRE